MKKILILIVLMFIPMYAMANFQMDTTQNHPYQFAYISSSTTTKVKIGAGVLHNIVVNGGTTGTIVVYNSLVGSGDIIASFDSTNALATYGFDVGFASGCTVVTGGATKLTVSYL